MPSSKHRWYLYQSSLILADNIDFLDLKDLFGILYDILCLKFYFFRPRSCLLNLGNWILIWCAEAASGWFTHHREAVVGNDFFDGRLNLEVGELMGSFSWNSLLDGTSGVKFGKHSLSSLCFRDKREAVVGNDFFDGRLNLEACEVLGTFPRNCLLLDTARINHGMRTLSPQRFTDLREAVIRNNLLINIFFL